MRHRVLVVPSWYPSDSSPVDGKFVADQVRALAVHHDVVVAAPRLVPRLRRGAGQAVTGSAVDVVPTLRPDARFWLPRRVSWAAALHAYDRALEGAFREFERGWGRPTVIHAHVVIPAGWAAVRLGRREGIPVVLTEHSGPFTMHLGTRSSRAAVREAIMGAKACLAVSPQLASDVRSFEPGGRYGVLGNVVDTVFFTPGEPSQVSAKEGAELRIVTVGAGLAQKNTPGLLRSAARAVARGRPVRLAICGESADADVIRALADELGLGERVCLVGRASREEVRGWLRWADIYVCASRSETFGVAVAEALSCGLPVITTRCGGPEWVVPEGCGELVEVDNDEALADAITHVDQLIQKLDPQLARGAIEDRFSAERIASQLGSIYDWAAGEPGAPDPPALYSAPQSQNTLGKGIG